jgi:hypothetical protein
MRGGVESEWMENVAARTTPRDLLSPHDADCRRGEKGEREKNDE